MTTESRSVAAVTVTPGMITAFVMRIGWVMVTPLPITLRSIAVPAGIFTDSSTSLVMPLLASSMRLIVSKSPGWVRLRSRSTIG